MNRKTFLLRSMACTATAALAFVTATAGAAAGGSADEAKAMTQRAAALVKAKGADTAYAEFINGHDFKDRDLYVSVYDMKGNCLAHGANPKLVGKNLWELKDVNGVEIIKMQTTIATTKGEGWSEPFTFVNPQTKAMQVKETYVQRVADTWIGVGHYK